MVRGLIACIVAAAVLCAPRTSLSMEMELVDDTLVLHGGSITLDDWVRYRELTQGKRFSKVVLANQSGGRIETGRSGDRKTLPHSAAPPRGQ